MCFGMSYNYKEKDEKNRHTIQNSGCCGGIEKKRIREGYTEVF